MRIFDLAPNVESKMIEIESQANRPEGQTPENNAYKRRAIILEGNLICE